MILFRYLSMRIPQQQHRFTALNDEMFFLLLMSLNGYVRQGYSMVNQDFYAMFLGNSWFAFEIILRFLVTPSKKAFFFSILNWIGR